MLLQAGSSAINAGGGVWLTADQRGLPRPILLPGYPLRPGSDGTDIGAVEMQAAGGSSHLVRNLNDDGLGSLRQAVSDCASGDIVTFSNGLTGAITLTSGEVAIGNDITILGPGANTLAVDGNASDRVLEILSGSTVTISGLTITNGLMHGADNPGGTAEAVSGGGILNRGSLALNDCWVAGNAAEGGDGSTAGAADGGGINSPGSLILTRCSLSGNSATGGNSDGDPGGAAWGGGISGSGVMTLVNCTLNGNSVLGGIPAGQAAGGGVLAGGSATLTAVSCTVSGNYATGGQSNTSPGGSAAGGGIGQQTATIQLLNTIVAGNGASCGASPPPILFSVSWDIYGSIVSLGFNLIGDAFGSSGWIASDQTGSEPSPLNPKLGPLQNNGGPTSTMMPLNGSPALDSGYSDGLSTDQRGRPRPARFTSNPLPAGGDGADIGAVEAQPPVLGIGQMKAGLGRVWLSWNSEPGWTWTLEQNSDAIASPTAWIRSSYPITAINGTNGVNIIAPAGHMIFRLKGAAQ
jgi:hypothetical protein